VPPPQKNRRHRPGPIHEFRLVRNARKEPISPPPLSAWFGKTRKSRKWRHRTGHAHTVQAVGLAKLCLALMRGGSLLTRFNPTGLHSKNQCIPTQFPPREKSSLDSALPSSSRCSAAAKASSLTNLTAPELPENPSQIYTLTLRVTPKISTIFPGSTRAAIIIDGQNYEMKKSVLGEGIYEFEYQLPAGRDELAYYFLVNYQTENANTLNPHDAYTELTHAHITHRNVLQLIANRGPVGARVSVVGRGFTPQDIIYFDSTPTRTVFESPNSLSFFVPSVDAARNYAVTVGGPAGNSPVGTFRIDSSNLSVTPSALSMRTGERQALTFTVPNAAPPGGLLLDVTTDVPESVIMPEVIVPQGQTSVTITVESGKPGSGSLFLKGYGRGRGHDPRLGHGEVKSPLTTFDFQAGPRAPPFCCSEVKRIVPNALEIWAHVTWQTEPNNALGTTRSTPMQQGRIAFSPPVSEKSVTPLDDVLVPAPRLLVRSRLPRAARGQPRCLPHAQLGGVALSGRLCAAQLPAGRADDSPVEDRGHAQLHYRRRGGPRKAHARLQRVASHGLGRFRPAR